MDNTPLDQARQALLAAQRILVTSHIRPDGDAIGSLLGLGLSLKEAGKQVQMILSDGVPAAFRFLEGSQQIRKKPEGDFDLSVVLDCSDFERSGSALNGHPTPDLNIDHHPTNLSFARINLIEVEAVATAEMLARYLPLFGLPLSKPSADALLFGLITDTLGFRTYNMTPRALRVAADLIEAGGDLPSLYFAGLLRRSFEAARFWGAGLSVLQKDGRLAWTTLSMTDRRNAGYLGRDDADLINVLTTVEDIDLIVIFVEQPNGHVKVSWRSKPGLDVSQLAVQFGGGGHAAAAGAEVAGGLQEVQEQVLSATRQLFSENIYNFEGIKQG
ncbi:MAG TPA: DHH family phosphoesterase [Anaerolineales bacterium]|nr:DHH family phosphoesterase [Anaerolineales bacterium]